MDRQRIMGEGQMCGFVKKQWKKKLKKENKKKSWKGKQKEKEREEEGFGYSVPPRECILENDTRRRRSEEEEHKV